MDMTPLEQDLIGDLAQDDHCLFEIFAFVRLHHGDDPSTVRSVGRQLLATWIARGWLETVSGPPFDADGPPPRITEVLDRVDKAEFLNAQFAGADTWLRLTDQAYHDVEWIRPST